jgi:hypothetical protein
MPFLPPGTGLRALAGASAPPPFTFPPDDLLHTLVDAYFTRVNASAPLLHRPSFARALADGAHRADGGFGALVLVVCAIASRFVDDARVMLDGAPSHSAGWKWFNQVQMVRRSLLAAPCLHDLQLYCVRTLLASVCSAPRTDARTAIRDVSPGLVRTTGVLEYSGHRHPPRARRRRASEEGI